MLRTIVGSVNKAGDTAPEKDRADIPDQWTYNYAVCLFQKNENRFLIEFVDYHLSIGFDHVFIIDNNSDVSPKATLFSYPDDLVTVDTYDDHKGRGKHGRAFQHFVRNHGRKCRWVAFIDTDEFVVPKTSPNIGAVLDHYDDAGALGVNMVYFGDSGHETMPDGPIIKNFNKAARYAHKKNLHVKCIANMRFVKRASANPHIFNYVSGKSVINERHEPFEGPVTPYFSNEHVQLNHYWSRSRDAFTQKIQRGGGAMA